MEAPSCSVRQYGSTALTIMNPSDEHFLFVWQKKRKSTFLAFLLQHLITGIQQSVILTVLWIYVEGEMQKGDKSLIYGLAGLTYNLSPIFLTVVISKWVDKTRKANKALVICNLICTAGNLLLILPFSPYLLVIGRICNGFILCARPVIAAEICRSYPKDEVQVKMSLVSCFALTGYAVGPLIILVFLNENVWVGTLHVSYSKASFLFIFILTMFQTIIVSFFVYDLSAQYDLKENEKTVEDNYEGGNLGEDGIDSDKANETLLPSSSSTEPTSMKVKAMFSSWDALLLLVLTFIGAFWEDMLHASVPYMFEDTLHWRKAFINYSFVAYASLAAILSFLTSLCSISEKSLVNIGILTWFGMLVIAICIRSIIASSDDILTLMLLFTYLICYSFFVLCDRVFIVVCFANKFSSRHQGFAESFRSMTKRIGVALGSAATLYVYRYFQYSFVVLVVTAILVVCCLLFRRKSLSNSRYVM